MMLKFLPLSARSWSRVLGAGAAVWVAIVGVGEIGAQEGGGKTEVAPNTVLARVDGVEIRLSEVSRRMLAMFQDSGMKLQLAATEGLMGQMREQLVNQMVAEVMIENAAKEAGLEATEAEVTAMLEEFKGRLPEGESFDAYLRRYGATEPVIREDLAKKLRVKKWSEMHSKKVVPPTKEEIEAIFRDRPEYAITLGKAKARHILLSTDDVKDEEHGRQRMREARAIWERLVGENPEDFEALAREVSEDTETAADGGNLGEVKEGELTKTLDRAIFTQPLGVVGPVVPSPYGLHIIRVDERTDTKVRTLEEATPVIRRHLIGKRHNELMFKLIEGLSDEAKIEVLDEETGQLVDVEVLEAREAAKEAEGGAAADKTSTSTEAGGA